MGPGPSDVSPRVLAAMARPTIGHLDPAFVELMTEVKSLLQYAFRTKNQLTIPISGPGTAGMEACIANLVEPGDSVLVCVNGVFGGRMATMAERMGGVVHRIESPWGEPIDLAQLEDALKKHPKTKAIAFVHAETSTGARSDARGIASLAHRYGTLTIADTVTSLGGIPLEVDEWSLDAVYSGTQKCLSCTPGLSPVTISERALSAIRARTHPVVSWFLDFGLVMSYWGEGQKRTYHHTAPVNAIYALHEALLVLREEGLEKAWARHQLNHEAFRAGLAAMGLELLVHADHRLPQLNAVRIPADVEDAIVRRAMLYDFGIEIGGGLGDLTGKIWRIGLMGFASNPRNVYRCLSALAACMRSSKHVSTADEGLAAAKAVYVAASRA
ncbi:MAG: alanine--glyoxylate aminotransferase family protein [Deltaproteobacteria bacterium]|nr:alanine--glyoxylate aminotransferase family protein [Deltaproteobacteria bacterium]